MKTHTYFIKIRKVGGGTAHPIKCLPGHKPPNLSLKDKPGKPVTPESKGTTKGPRQKMLGPISRDSHQLSWENLRKLARQSSQWAKIYLMHLNVWTWKPKPFIYNLWRILGVDSLFWKLVNEDSELSILTFLWRLSPGVMTIKTLPFWNSHETMDSGNSDQDSWSPQQIPERMLYHLWGILPSHSQSESNSNYSFIEPRIC